MPEIKMRHYQTGALDAFAAGVRNGMRNQLITLPTGTGKCFARGTSILMYDGTVKAVEDIVVSDLLMGPDSSSRKVLSLGRGRDMLYRITPEKGNSYVVNESHILSLKMTKKVSKGKSTLGRQCAAETIVNIQVSEYLQCNKAFKDSAKGYRTGVEFAARTEILCAYLLASWLADGDRSGPLEYREVADYFGVFDSVGNKCIAQRYKCNTREIRLKLLAGLIDAKGHSVKGGYTLMLEGRTLANDVAFVARSLGLAAYVKYCRDMNATTKTESWGFRVSISGDCDVIPLRSLSKTQLDPQRKDVLVHGIKVKAVGVGDYYGFEIDGDRLFLLADFTVVHNTVLFVRAARHAGLKGTVLIIAHRDRLISQAKQKWLEAHPEDRVGIEMADQRTDDEPYDCIVSSVQTLKGARLSKFVETHGSQVCFIVTDECFPAGTKVDGRNIESIQVGDKVRCYNHDTLCVENRSVVRLFKSQATSLVRVTLSDKRVIHCTPGHPFWNGTGYVEAIILKIGDMVYYHQESGELKSGNQSETLHSLRNGISTELLDTQNGTNLLAGMQTGTAGGTSPCCNSALSKLRNFSSLRDGQSGLPQEGSSFLQSELSVALAQQNFVGDYGSDQQNLCVKAYDGKESNALCGDTSESQQHTSGDELETDHSGWKWKTTDNSSGIAIRDFGVGNGIGSIDKNEAQQWDADSLQDRHCQSNSKDSDRSGWSFAPTFCAERTGQKEGSILVGTRVECVEVLEQTSDGTFGGMCPDGYVYNIEVEGNHNYFVNNVLVHNCHHSTEPSYTAIFEEFRCLPVDMQTGLRPLENQSAPVLLGVTATPKRLDKHLLENVYPFSTYDYPLLDAMREKYLCAVKAFRVETDVDLRGIKQQSGEFNQRELAERVDVKDRVDLVVKQWKKLGGMKRRTADFCTSKAQCHSHAAEYRKHTPNVYVITEEVKGAVREAMLEEFSWGPLPQVVISVDVMTEGTDIAQLDMIVNSAPTKSASRFIQRIGRGLRPYVGGSNPSTEDNPTWPSVLPVKDHLLFLDIVDTVRSQSDLMTVPRILGLPASFDLHGDDLLEAKNVMDEILNRDPALEAALKTMAETDEKMPKTFKELKAELQRIMLFAPNNPRGKSKEYSKLAWLAADERAIMDNDADNSHAYVLNVAAPRDPRPGEVAQQRSLRLEYRPVSGFWFIMIQAPNPERTALEREAAYNVNQAKRYDIPVQYKGQFYAKAKAANQAAARLPLVTLKEMQLYPDLDRSIVHIDGYVRKRYSSALHLLELDAAWRRKMPSSGQLYFAKSAQIPVHPDMRAGDVSDLINNHKNLKVHEESL